MANKFKTFLEHLGSMFKVGAEKALAIESKLLPAEEAAAAVVSTMDPAAGGTFGAILGSVVNVEQVATALGASTGTGEQKLAAALPQVEQAVLANPLFKGKKIANLALWNKAIGAIASATADLMNSVEAPAPTTPAA
ncbi:MAG: hypothetical protein ACP5EP_03790 [Acidobacteriaceae bacterium]